MEHAGAARDLHVQRKPLFEAMLPVDGEAEEVDVELPRLRLIENAENRDHRTKIHDPAAYTLRSGRNDDDSVASRCFDRRAAAVAPLPAAAREGARTLRERHGGGRSGDAGWADDRVERRRRSRDPEEGRRAANVSLRRRA